MYKFRFNLVFGFVFFLGRRGKKRARVWSRYFFSLFCKEHKEEAHAKKKKMIDFSMEHHEHWTLME